MSYEIFLKTITSIFLLFNPQLLCIYTIVRIRIIFEPFANFVTDQRILVTNVNDIYIFYSLKIHEISIQLYSLNFVDRIGKHVVNRWSITHLSRNYNVLNPSERWRKPDTNITSRVHSFRYTTRRWISLSQCQRDE